MIYVLGGIKGRSGKSTIAINLSFIPVSIGHRKAFANAAAQGLGVTEFKPVDKKAISEFMRLLSYLTKYELK